MVTIASAIDSFTPYIGIVVGAIGAGLVGALAAARKAPAESEQISVTTLREVISVLRAENERQLREIGELRAEIAKLQASMDNGKKT
jgi:hypothetical protein